MIVRCPGCGLQIRSADMNLDNMVAKCRSCDSLIDLRGQLADTGTASALVLNSKQTTSAAAVPTGWSVNNSGGNTKISWRWFSLQFVPLAFFCIAWDSFLVFWYSMALVNHGPLMMVLFPIAHVAVGVSLTYYTISGFLNRTSVILSSREIEIRHGPVPWLGNRKVSASEIRDIDINSTSINSVFTNRSAVPGYRLDAITTSNQTIPLVTLKGEEQARFIKQQIKERLVLRIS